MNLNLERPLIFFDLETTGVDPAKDRIIELCYIKVFPDGTKEEKTLRVNPERHIPEESSKVHGIYDKDVESLPPFKAVASSIVDVFKDCDVAGFNSNHFDIPMLVEEILRAGLQIDFGNVQCIDVQNIYHKLEQRTLSAAYAFYCHKNLENAHSAFADTRATLEVLEAQLEKYPETLQNDVKSLAAFSRRSNNVDMAGRFVYGESGEILFNFGKHKGKVVEDVLKVEPGYYNWMIQGDFPLNTKQVISQIYFKEHKK